VTHTASQFEVRRLAHRGGSIFRGKTALLTDGRTIGTAERAGLFMQAANNTVIIGTASAGAISDIETASLPGGISFSWSGKDFQLNNGGKVQRLGLQPTLVVPRSVADIRSGKDEVLTRAVEYLAQPDPGKGP
jgi:C-terminal processing protease CtpA/Prc